MPVKESGGPGAPRREITPRRRAYADWMEIGTRCGAAGIAMAYVGYVTGLIPPHVPIPRIAAHWHLPAGELAAACGFYRGPSWLLAFREGDYLTLILLAFLATVTVWSFIRLLPFLLRARDVPMIAVTLAQLTILALAASGLFSGGP